MKALVSMLMCIEKGFFWSRCSACAFYEDALYGVKKVGQLSRLPKECKEEQYKSCEARLGDEIEVHVKNLWSPDAETWIR